MPGGWRRDGKAANCPRRPKGTAPFNAHCGRPLRHARQGCHSITNYFIIIINYNYFL